MSTLSLQEAEPITVDDFSALEERVVRAVELVKRERAARAEAEQKAARKLGVTPQTIAQAAYDIWGRSLTDERNLQVEQLDWVDETSTRQVQAYRGHVTRELLDKIETHMASNPDTPVELDEEH